MVMVKFILTMKKNMNIIKGNSKLGKLMDMEFLYYLMEIFILDILKTICATEMEYMKVINLFSMDNGMILI